MPIIYLFSFKGTRQLIENSGQLSHLLEQDFVDINHLNINTNSNKAKQRNSSIADIYFPYIFCSIVFIM